MRFFEHRLVVRQLPFGLIELRLIDVTLDAEQLRSLRDRGAILIIDRFQIALNARDEIHGLERRGVAGQLEVQGHRLLQGLRDDDFRRRRRDVRVFGAAARESKRGNRRQDGQTRATAFAG